MAADTDTIAGTTISRYGRAVLLRGPSGAGKSDLALRAITQPILLAGEQAASSFDLVSDDQTCLTMKPGSSEIDVAPPASIAGLLEVRGVGIKEFEPALLAKLVLIADLTNEPVERMPPGSTQTVPLLGHSMPRIMLRPFESSAPVKLALALRDAS